MIICWPPSIDTLIDSLCVKEDEVLMNLLHCYFNLNDTTNAMTSPEVVDPELKQNSAWNAYQQLGKLSTNDRKTGRGVTISKKPLKTDPTTDARYAADYEMVKKKLEEKKK